MRARPLLQLTARRLRPSSWGALPLFLVLLLPLRWVLGGPVLPWHWHALIGAMVLMGGYFLLSPLPWLWTGDDRHRAGFVRGIGQTLCWDVLWLAGFALLHGLIGGPEPPRVTDAIQRIALRSGTPLPVFWVLAQLPFAALAGWFMAELEARGLDHALAETTRRELERHAREAEAQALRAQLDPHVLYNALSALSELTRENPARAEEVLLDFSDFYRRLTVLRERPFVQLGEERALLEQYLAIEALRLGSRLNVEWTWPKTLDGLSMPPLLTLPLVENAVKHGLAPEKEGGTLRLQVERTPDGGLAFRIWNSGKPLVCGTEPTGTGLRNLRARLALLGQGTSALELRSEGAGTLAHLILEPGIVTEPE